MRLQYVNGLRWLVLATLLYGLLPREPAHAQTIDEITSRGSINIGVLTDVPPYGFLNAQQEPDGYDVEVSRLLTRYLGVKLTLVQLTAPNRIPFLVTNKVDLIVGSLGITPERAKQIAFSIPYSAMDNVVWSARARTIEQMADLRGLTIGVARGSTQDLLFTGALGSSARIMRFDDSSSTYQALLSGQVDAIGEGRAIAVGIFRNAPAIGPKFLLARQPNGIAMRTGQANLLQWVNTFIYYVRNNGELDALYRKYFDERFPELGAF